MISRIVSKNGSRMFEIDGKLFLPAAFRSFRPTPANISLFYRNGIRLFQMQCSGINNKYGIPYSLYGGAWIGDHKYDFSVLDKQMEMFMKFAPDGYFMLMPVLDMPDWWIKENNFPFTSFYKIGEAYYEKKWIEDASDYLTAFLNYAEEKYGERIFGYSFSAGRTTEWFDGTGEPSERKMAAFREAVKDESIPKITLEQIKDKSLPTLVDAHSPLFLYNRYESSLVPEIISHFAKVFQKVINHKKIVGIFYGYSCLPTGWQNQTATTGYESVWCDENIDMFFAPAAYYKSRLPHGTSSYQNAVNSLELHKKLYLHEIDHRTHLASYPIENGMVMPTDYQNETETINILRRELCAVICKDAALWWFDFFGGYYSSPGLEKELRLQMKILKKVSKLPHKSVSEIAVFVDPKSFHYMKDESGITYDCVGGNRDTLNECGAPYDFYNQNDLPMLDHSNYKMYVFLNALEIPEHIKKLISEKLSDKTLVWIYAPNLYSGKSEQVCGMKLKEFDGPDIKAVYKNEEFGFKNPTKPTFTIDDAEAQILASYTNGLPACAKKGNSIYIATGNVPSSLWRDIAKEAGVHIYTDLPGALYVDSRIIARQTVHAEDIELKMPYDCVLEDLFDKGTFESQNKIVRYRAENSCTKLFLIHKK